MKIKIYTLALLVFSAFSCQKDFLDRSPIIGNSEANFYKTQEDAIAAINAAYAPLQFELSPDGHFRWFWGDIMSDDSEKGGSGDNDVFDLLLLETFQGPTTTGLLEAEWGANYEGIYRANVVLDKIPDIEMNAALKARILAEAKFIRAWFNYNLVTVFGGVPMVDHVLAPSELNMPRNSASDIWNLINADLISAIANLPERSEYAMEDLGRITKGAARGLLAKASLWQMDYQEAKTQTDAIMASGEYSLDPSYASIFTRQGENGPGSIFEIQYMSESGGNWGKNSANEGTFTNVFTRARGQFAGYGFNIPTQDLVDAFFLEDPNNEDPRLASTVFRVGDEMGDRGTFTKDATGTAFDFHPKKYFTSKSEDAALGDPNPNGGSNDRVIRFADVLLMNAEASYHLGQEAAARDAVNQVRARARGTSTTLLPDIIASGSDLLDAIYHERRVELALEGHRFFDLVRTNRAQNELSGLGYNDAVHKVFPIPQSQIQATNGAITQNPGY